MKRAVRGDRGGFSAPREGQMPTEITRSTDRTPPMAPTIASESGRSAAALLWAAISAASYGLPGGGLDGEPTHQSRCGGAGALGPGLMAALINPADRIFVAGHRGMAGSAICRALQRSGYGDPAQGCALLTATRQELDLLDAAAVQRWFAAHQPTVVVLVAAKVGGIEANNSYPADFLLENLKIQTHVIETAWRSGVRRLLFLGSSCIYPKFAEQPIREEALLTGALEPTNEW